MNIKEKIYVLLKSNPKGLKAKNIGSALGLDKSEVNSFLYSNLDTFQIDSNYVWTIKASNHKWVSKEEQFRVEVINILQNRPYSRSHKQWRDVEVVRALNRVQLKTLKKRCEEIRNNSNLPTLEEFRIIEIAILPPDEFEEKISDMEANEASRRKQAQENLIQQQIEKAKNRDDELRREYIQQMKKRGYRL